MRRLFAVALATALVAACGGGNPTAPNGGGNPPPVVTVTMVSIRIEGPVSVTAGTTAQLRIVAKYSDGSERNVISSGTFKTLSYGVADVTPNGVVVPQSLGNAQIQGNYNGMSSVATVAIVGTQWSQLSPLTDDERAWVKSFVLSSNGSLYKLKADSIITVWVSPAVKSQYVADATAFWTTESRGKWTYRLVADSSTAQAWVVPDPTLPDNSCGRPGWSNLDEARHIYMNGIVRLNPSTKLNCLGSSLVLTHEMGHLMGLNGHTTQTVDIMNVSPVVGAGTSPFIDHLVAFISTTPAGTIPVDP